MSFPHYCNYISNFHFTYLNTTILPNFIQSFGFISYRIEFVPTGNFVLTIFRIQSTNQKERRCELSVVDKNPFSKRQVLEFLFADFKSNHFL